MKTKVELLAPAGSIASLRAAINAGADAVYIGGSKFGARAFADNPSEEELLDAIDYVHLFGKKIYLTVNTLIKDSEVDEVLQYLEPYYECGIDAVIVQDLGLVDIINKIFPKLEIHASTQMSITTEYGASFLKNIGVKRVVPAREISLEEIKTIYKKTDIELECFIHGAMCYSYSGQCMFSSILGGRSGNRGQCAQPCRLPYSVYNAPKRDLLSMKDLCTIDILPELINAGISSFKIEGRMKSSTYVYEVVSIYRKYIDLFNRGEPYNVLPLDRERLIKAYTRRGYTQGYYKEHNSKEMISLTQPKVPENNNIKVTEPSYDTKIHINGNVCLYENKMAKMEVKYNSEVISVSTEIVQSALKQPLNNESVKAQMCKTGNTVFVFDELKIFMSDNVFMTMKQLNVLRRTALRKLENSITNKYKRIKSTKKLSNPLTGFKNNQTKNEPLVSASVQSLEQYDALDNAASIKRVYIEANIWSELHSRNRSKEIIIALPFIFRIEDDAFLRSILNDNAGFDGVLVRNLEELELLKVLNYKGIIIADYNLYSFNQYAKAFLLENNVNITTVSLELNKNEMKSLDINDMELIFYGRIPLMISANCIKKSVEKCNGIDEIINLKDRYNKSFPVKNYCKYCYNVIYNSVVLNLTSEDNEVSNLKPDSIRYMFTDETKQQVNKILNEQIIDSDFTKGHFKRGVK
ncbi:MAG: peptidase U32 family protein [Suipraeoptans sp.]